MNDDNKYISIEGVEQRFKTAKGSAFLDA